MDENAKDPGLTLDGEEDRSIDKGMGIIITKWSNSIPFPAGYDISLPDTDKVNCGAYAAFHNAVGRLMVDKP